MCTSRPAFVEAKVYTRLVEKGVDPARAAGVARKVRRRYEEVLARARDSRPAAPTTAARPR